MPSIVHQVISSVVVPTIENFSGNVPQLLFRQKNRLVVTYELRLCSTLCHFERRDFLVTEEPPYQRSIAGTRRQATPSIVHQVILSVIVVTVNSSFFVSNRLVTSFAVSNGLFFVSPSAFSLHKYVR